MTVTSPWNRLLLKFKRLGASASSPGPAGVDMNVKELVSKSLCTYHYPCAPEKNPPRKDSWWGEERKFKSTMKG
jgi:hypothetical protein